MPSWTNDWSFLWIFKDNIYFFLLKYTLKCIANSRLQNPLQGPVPAHAPTLRQEGVRPSALGTWLLALEGGSPTAPGWFPHFHLVLSNGIFPSRPPHLSCSNPLHTLPALVWRVRPSDVVRNLLTCSFPSILSASLTTFLRDCKLQNGR